ncbi:super-infection exclusion protein B [Pediococcus acidilactici]|uniref:super-infection exclusion protein B n=1 Tax=Pediococcus acidilactici TaxID=1254 RepID=UPI00232E62BF|nr:super-infection exclusion protein B [Pediococcus acidilactici]MDB8860118.1 super-infection exclusion protein B [Pediococcus acidilactici]MDB8861115.1 super-infection exclusion protein B [Pediococcus acidilactici]MDB8863844.1 super-infection exclusion protein B [Pediococcus acidilactici]MDB8866006.1 super-infection exclusion protein B [Pediococcus acidilactici]
MDIKAITELLKLNEQQKVSIAIITSIMTIFKKYIIENFNAEKFYHIFGFMIFILMISMWTIVLVDLITPIINKFSKNIKRTLEKRSNNKFLSELNERQRQIVEKLYCSEGYSCYFKQHDTDVLFLQQSGVIEQLKAEVIFRESQVEDINNPPIPYALQPWVVDYMSLQELGNEK